MEWRIPSFPVLLTFLLFIIMVRRIRKKLESNSLSNENLPPGPWKLPFIGNLHQLVSSQPHHRIANLAKKYGAVMQLQLGEVSTIVISSPEAAKEVMKTHEINFVNKPQFLVTAIMFYNCKDIFFAPHGDRWRQLRKICILELLSAKRVQSFRSIRQEEVSNLIKSISSKAGLPINLSKMMFTLVNGIAVRTSISKKCKNQEAFLTITEEIVHAVAGLNIVDLFPSVKLFHLISTVKLKVERVHREVDNILEDIINGRRNKNVETKNAETKNGENESADLLDVLLNLQGHGNFDSPITTENIKAIILDMFVAGSETATAVLEWAMSEMLKNPRVMKKAQKEVREVLTDVETIDETCLHELKFLKLIIKETMRLHPPASLIPRECREGCKIKGYDIRAKSRLMINAWAIGRDPDYWNEADKFQPERFQDSSIDYKGTNFEFIPFGAGMRICPGMLFGIAIIELTLAKLLYHFDWELPNGVQNENLDMTEAFSGTVRRKQDLNVIPISCTCLSPMG